MTRFAMEWNGQLGAYWEAQAHAEAERLMGMRADIEVDDDGAAKWVSSGRYLPADVVEKLTFAGADFFSAEATAVKRTAQNAAFIDSYSRNHKGPSAEERIEMAAAFGKGTTVVNVITGTRTRL